MSMYTNLGNALHIQVENEQIEIRAWAPNSFRVRARMSGDILDQDWALLPTPPRAPTRSRRCEAAIMSRRASRTGCS